ncbi:hypothetical protein CSV72_14420 [Sporosarcina sp. P20a]|nr:hypothetical protein CSV72_14420 [Sporosarcina sp. P20a]
MGSWLDWLLGTEVSACLLSAPAQARGGIAYSQEPAGDGAASCLLATAYPAVVRALLSGIHLFCGSKNDKLRTLTNLQTRLAERLCGCGSLSLFGGVVARLVVGD